MMLGCVECTMQGLHRSKCGTTLQTIRHLLHPPVLVGVDMYSGGAIVVPRHGRSWFTVASASHHQAMR